MATDAVSYEIREAVAVLTLGGAAGHTLDAAARAALFAALARAEADAEAQAILLTGRGAAFCEGASLAEYDAPEAEPTLRALCDRVEASAKPVLAVLHGAARGPGFELALAAHYRIAGKTCALAMPEISLGLLPSGGTTQRLPRVLGAGKALEFLAAPRGRRAGDKALRPLIEAEFDGDRVVAGLAFLRKLIDEGAGPRPTRARSEGLADPIDFQSRVAQARTEAEAQPELARRELVRAVEAAQLLPFDVGVAFEAGLAETCRTGRQSVSLRHLFRAERLAERPARAQGGTAAPVARLGIIGGGAMARGLAVLALRHGREVRLLGPEAAAREDLTARLAEAMGPAPEGWRERLTFVEALSELAPVDLLVEASGEAPERVAARLRQAAGHLSDAAPLCVAGAGDGLTVVAAALGEEAVRLAGLALRAPVQSVRLVEVSVVEDTGADALATVIRCLREMGRTAVLAAPRPVAAGAELFRCWQALALALADQGVHPHSIDRALTAHGHAAGPFLAMEAEGLAAVRAGLEAAGLPQGRTLEALIAAGRGGAGRGLYLHPEGAAAPLPDETLADDLPVPPRAAMPAAAIVHLANAALANRGARMLRWGVVDRASDLDVAMVAGWGYPRLAGGPMKSADISGLFSVQRLMEQFARTTGDRAWRPDRLLRDMVRNGRRFCG